jgi:hypothetical protein
MPWSGQEELQKTKARLVREQRQRTLRRQREILYPTEGLLSDSDTDSEPESTVDTAKPDHLSQYKRDLCLTVFCASILTIAANLLMWQYILLRKA